MINNSESTEYVCESCGKNDGTVKEVLDPYMLEIHNEEIVVRLCEECEYQRRMDI